MRDHAPSQGGSRLLQDLFRSAHLKAIGLDLDTHPAYGEKTVKNTQPASPEISSEIKDLLYRVEQSSPSRRVAEEPAIPEKTLRLWCESDEEFTAARSLAGELGIRLLD
jgi:hypothetical protein